MTETEHIGALLKSLRVRVGTQGVIFKHQDARTTGVPDFSLTLLRATSWWEGKLARNYRVSGTELQRTFMRRLAVAGRAWYIVWDDLGWNIVRPQDIRENGSYAAVHAGQGSEAIIDVVIDYHLGLIEES